MQNQPLPSERVDGRTGVGDRATHCDDAGGKVLDKEGLELDNDDDGDRNGEVNESDSDGASPAYYGSLDGEPTNEYIAPRPLGILSRDHNAISITNEQTSVTYPKLKYLYLCKPAEGEIESISWES